MGMDTRTNGGELNEMRDDYVPDAEVAFYVREAFKSVYQVCFQFLVKVDGNLCGDLLRLESGELGEFVGTLAPIAVVDRLVDLDVEIILDPNEETSSKGIFDMELDDIDENEDDAEKVGHKVSRGKMSRQSLAANDFANKLDNLMVLTCEHLKSCATAGRLDELFETLMVSFESTVMLALKSKFAQFVIFYASSLDPENCGVKFADG